MNINYKILFLIINLPLTQLFSQNPLEDGTEWQYYMTSFFSDDPDDYRLFADGDTTINNIECKVVKREKINCNLRSTYEEYMYIDGSKWYYYHFDDQNFYPLYDFGIDIGDTVALKTWGYYETWGEYLYYKVDSIKTINYNGEALKHFYCTSGWKNELGEIVFHENYPFSIIENIGNTGNIFFFIDTGFCDGRHVRKLNCYTNPNSGHYIHENAECISVANTELYSKNNFNIYPNPCKDKLTIETNTKIKAITVINLNGIQLREVELIGNKTEIEVSSLAPGFYILKLHSTTGVRYYQKILKS